MRSSSSAPHVILSGLCAWPLCGAALSVYKEEEVRSQEATGSCTSVGFLVWISSLGKNFFHRAAIPHCNLIR